MAERTHQDPSYQYQVCDLIDHRTPVGDTSKGRPQRAKSPPERFRLAANVIVLGAPLRSAKGYFQEGSEAARFEVGAVVQDGEGDLLQVSRPYGEYEVDGEGPRFGYACKYVYDDNERNEVFCRAGWLHTPRGKPKHLRLVG